MSLIYKSLQELDKREIERKSSHFSAAGKTRPKRNARIFFVSIFGTIAVVFIFMNYTGLNQNTKTDSQASGAINPTYEIKENISRTYYNPIKTRNNSDLSQLKQVNILNTPQEKRKGTYTKKDKIVQNMEESASNKHESTSLHKKNTPKSKDTIKKTINQHKTQAQDVDFFSKRNNKNVRISNLEQRLKRFLKTRQWDELEKNLKKLDSIIGSRSFLALKWRGVMYLQKNKAQKAENLFKQALSIRPLDVESRVNLILTLLRQEKKKQAREIYKRLVSNRPLNKNVRKLESVFE